MEQKLDLIQQLGEPKTAQKAI